MFTFLQGFLKNERENALLSAIEQARKNTFEETERRHWETMESEWEREKQKILNALVGSGHGVTANNQFANNHLITFSKFQLEYFCFSTRMDQF